MSGMAKPYKRKESRFWWIAPWIKGQQVRQSSGETDFSRAERKLRILEGKIAANAPITPRTDRNSFAALLEAVRTDYKIKRRRSLSDLERRIDKHLIPFLGHFATNKVTRDMLAEYTLSRQTDDASNASINRELAIVKRAFKLGLESGSVSAIPKIELLPEDNTREGFFSVESFRSVLKHSNPLLCDVLTAAYFTGWRIQSIIGLEWRQVDLEAGVVRLYAVQTKNRKPTAFPLAPFPELRSMLERRLESTRETEKRLSRVIPHVFHRAGQEVRSIRTGWQNAREKAGVPGRMIHDLRRTAVRNLKRMGFSDTDVMNMVGFKTMSIMYRYNITTEEDILEKGRIIAERVAQKL